MFSVGVSPIVAFLIIGFGGLFLGRFFWAFSKALAKPLSIALPFLLALVFAFVAGFLAPGDGRGVIPVSLVIAVVAGLLIQQLLLVGSIAKLESDVAQLRRQVSNSTPLDRDLSA